MVDDSNKKLKQLIKVHNRMKRDMFDDTYIRVSDCSDLNVIPYSADSDRLRRMTDKVTTEGSTVQNYGPPLVINAKDLDSIKGVYIP